MSIDVLTVSSKGQISLPSEMRKRLSIKQGDKYAVYGTGDIIMLKLIKVPTEDDFKAMLTEAQEWAASVNLTDEDVNDAIKSVRGRKQR